MGLLVLVAVLCKPMTVHLVVYVFIMAIAAAVIRWIMDLDISDCRLVDVWHVSASSRPFSFSTLRYGVRFTFWMYMLFARIDVACSLPGDFVFLEHEYEVNNPFPGLDGFYGRSCATYNNIIVVGAPGFGAQATNEGNLCVVSMLKHTY